MSTYLAMSNCPEGVFEEERAVSYYDDGRYLIDTFGRTGTTINHRNALEISSVWQAVNLISGDIAKLGLHMFQRDPGEQAGELVTTHPAAKLVYEQANPFMTAFEFWRRIMAHALVFNHGYVLIEFDSSNRPVGLWPLLPDRTVPYVYVDGGLASYQSDSSMLMIPGAELVYRTLVGGQELTLPDYRVLHVTSANLDSVNQCDLVMLARESWSLNMNTEQFTNAFFENGANAGGTLEFPLGMKHEAINNVLEAFRRIHSGAQKAGKTIPLRDGVKYNQLNVNLDDTQLNELREFQVKEVARWYNLPPHKLGDSSNASYNSLEQENKSYLQSTLMPWLQTITTQCKSKLVSNRNAGYYFEHDTRSLVQADAESQAKTITTLTAGGILNPDEGRSWIGLNKRPDGEGDQYYYSNNMQPVGEEPEPQAQPPMIEPPAEDDEDVQEASERTCAHCGSEPAKRIYCSQKCRQAAYKLRKKGNSDD